MSEQLESLRYRFGTMLVWLLWLHVPLLAVAAWVFDRDMLVTLTLAISGASIYHATFLRYGSRPQSRYMSAVMMMAAPAALVFLLRNHPWQMDMHMYFFALLALTIGWFDRRAVLVAATVVALHHAILHYVLPSAVFPEDGSVKRVLLHAAIVAVQSAVLVWVADTVVAKFAAKHLLGEQLKAINAALEERTREAEVASATKSMFLANMSHEIRTPLNAVLGFCHLLQRTALSSRQEDYVRKIGASGSALLRLINDILDYSKNEAGKLELESRPFSIRNAIEQQLQMVLADAKGKGLLLHVEHDERLPPSVMGDELRFGQVVLNFLSNAVKFTDSGSVTVLTRVKGEAAQSLTLEVEVADTGIGMTEEQLERLFTSFAQADNTMTRRFGGTGLGLAIARQIVQQMGGEVQVSSQEGQGTSFTFTVVLNKYAGEAQPVLTLHPSLRKLRILAVDDNPASRQIIREVFAEWSVRIDTASAAEEAIARLESASEVGREYDLLLLDWKMPGMDGLQAARLISVNPAITRKPQMVVLTAYGSDKFAAEVESSGIRAYLTKPLQIGNLRDAVEDIFLQPEEKAARGEESAGTQDTSKVLQLPGGLQGVRVLLVEDNEINREIATELLTDAGLLVDAAENGLIACQMVETEGDAYAAVLMDVQMPVMDGLNATRRIRKSWSASRLPIIAMTAHAYGEEIQHCLDAGMNAHIAKPVDPQMLIRTLEANLGPRPGPGLVSAPIHQEAADPDLPDLLPPFGIARALERVNGKKALLRRIIINFSQTQAGAVAEMRQAIAEARFSDAARLAHTLKGVAGSLELVELQKSAASVELALAAGDASLVEVQLSQTEVHLLAAVQAARGLSGLTSAAPQPEVKPDGASDLLIGLRQQLYADLACENPAARNSFARLAAAEGLSAEDAANHPIRRALDQLDYKAALVVLSPRPSGSDQSPDGHKPIRRAGT